MKPAIWRLIMGTALLPATATPVSASPHSPAECREGGEFIRNAALSRDNGLSRDAFLNHLIADLSMIRAMPEGARWFARDEADESLLVRHAERVYDQGESARANEDAFLADCSRGLAQSQR